MVSSTMPWAFDRTDRAVGQSMETYVQEGFPGAKEGFA
jgi:hypothetical protein